jgi:hypothetical protein
MTDHNPAKPPRPSDPHQAEFDPGQSYSAEENAQIRKTQAARSRITGVLLLGMCVLFFAITVAKIGYW